MAPFFRERASGPERMDLPNCDPKRLLATVRQFRLINRLFSRSLFFLEETLVQPLLRSGRREASFLEPGAGGCDVPLRLVERCRRLGIRIRVTCLEQDPRIVAFARERCREVPEIRVGEGDALAPGALDGHDFVFSNNFLHHMEEPEILTFLTSLASARPRGFLLNDLHRSLPAWIGYALFASVYLHRRFARYDGLLSIRRGFCSDELDALVRQAGLADAEVRRRPPALVQLIRPWTETAGT